MRSQSDISLVVGTLIAFLPVATAFSPHSGSFVLGLSVVILLLGRTRSENSTAVKSFVMERSTRYIVISICGLAMWALASVTWAPVPTESIYRWFRLAVVVSLAITLLALITRPEMEVVKRTIKRTLLFTAAFLCVLHLLITDAGNIAEFNKAATTLAILQLAIFPTKKSDFTALTGLTLLLTALATFLSASETAKLLLVIQLPILALAYLSPRLTTGLLAVAVSVLVLITPFAISLVKSTVPTFMLETRWFSAGGRFEIWQDFSSLVPFNFLTGYGVGSSPSFATPANPLPPGIIWATDANTHPHNGIIQLWLELGAVGVVAVLILVLLLFWKILRSEKQTIPIRLTLFVFVFIVVFVSHGVWQSWWLALIAMSVIIVRSSTLNVGLADQPNDISADARQLIEIGTNVFSGTRRIALIGILAGIVLGASITLYTWKPWADRGNAFFEIKKQQFTISVSEKALRNVRFNIEQYQYLKQGLEKYRKENGTYPLVSEYTPIQKSLNDLQGDYVNQLGITRTRDGKSVILYRSDGTNYKVFSYRNGDCYLIRQLEPSMVDPIRSSGEVDCSAYGIWTEGAERW